MADREANSKGKREGSPLSDDFFEIAAAMDQQGAEKAAWFDYRPSTDDMTYECDMSLGTPRSVDCNKLEYSQLGTGSDTIQIGPQVPKVLSTGK